jgi:hypothetical protein
MERMVIGVSKVMVALLTAATSTNWLNVRSRRLNQRRSRRLADQAGPVDHHRIVIGVLVEQHDVAGLDARSVGERDAELTLHGVGGEIIGRAGRTTSLSCSAHPAPASWSGSSGCWHGQPDQLGWLHQ